MNIKTTIDEFFYTITLNELHLMNTGVLDGTLTYNSLLYLDLIRMKEDCTVSYLADCLHVAKSAVTLKVKELQKLGLITKTQSTTDKRVYYLRVVDSFEKTYQCYDTAMRQAEEEITTHYSQAQVERFCEMLHIFSKHYQHQTKE